MKICTIGDCDRVALAKGMCAAHYNRVRLGKSKNPDAPVRLIKRNGLKCKEENCTESPTARGFCISHYHRKRRESPEELQSERAYRFKRSYGITMAQRQELLKKANFKCEICAIELEHEETKQSYRTCHIDHDHDTNKIRGVLCPNCNRGLGMFKDKIDVLEAALNYLKKHEDITE